MGEETSKRYKDQEANQSREWYPLFPKTYRGYGEFPQRHVTVNGLPLRDDVAGVGPGFEWGYLGGGPYNLAYSILYDFFSGRERLSDELTQQGIITPWEYYHQAFLDEVVANFSNESSWEITSDQITAWKKAKPEYDMNRWQKFLVNRSERRLQGYSKLLQGVQTIEPYARYYIDFEQYQEQIKSFSSKNTQRDGMWIEQVEDFEASIAEVLGSLFPRRE